VHAGTDDDHVHLDAFTPWRGSIIWKFNRMFCLGNDSCTRRN
jgi:biotin synthase-related radical SAM superfamily protein